MTLEQVLLSIIVGLVTGLGTGIVVARYNHDRQAAEALKAERLSAYIEAMRHLNSLPMRREELRLQPGSAAAQADFRALMEETHSIGARLGLIGSGAVVTAWRNFDRAWEGRSPDIDRATVKTILDAHQRKILSAMRDDLGVEALSDEVLKAVTTTSS